MPEVATTVGLAPETMRLLLGVPIPALDDKVRIAPFRLPPPVISVRLVTPEIAIVPTEDTKPATSRLPVSVTVTFAEPPAMAPMVSAPSARFRFKKLVPVDGPVTAFVPLAVQPAATAPAVSEIVSALSVTV